MEQERLFSRAAWLWMLRELVALSGYGLLGSAAGKSWGWLEAESFARSNFPLASALTRGIMAYLEPDAYQGFR